jgi:CDP-diacylglycerol--serine O-phosphatidyltransferase
MLRSLALADLLTLGNAAAGTLSIFICLHALDSRSPQSLWVAFVLLPLALVLDFLDGTVARWRRKASYLGADLDSLADIISFGVAPAVLGYTLGLRDLLDLVLLTFFVLCGVARLARYNATLEQLCDERGKVSHYQGLPIPSSLLLVGVLGVAFGTDATGDALWLGRLEILGQGFHPLSVVYLLSGLGMISATLKIPKP